MKLKFSLIILSLLAVTAGAFNHPEIKWKSVTSNHFIINYYDKTEPLLYAAWKIAEEAYGALCRLYKYTPTDKIALSLADYDDYSNGFAEWTAANIMIWIPDSRFELRSNTTWLRNVITHELTHIMSLEQKKRFQLVEISAMGSLTTPYERFAVAEPFAGISVCPSWLAEGIAQYETARLGNDCWDSRREMVLRSAVLNNTLLSLDEMAYFNHDALGNELVYNQGFAFTKYIAGRIGEDKLRMLFHSASSAKTDFEYAFRKIAGCSFYELYKRWTDSLRLLYASKYRERNEQYGIIYGKGRFNVHPVVSPDGNYIAWFSSGRDDGDRTDLIVAARRDNRILYSVPYGHTALCFSAASDKVYFVRSRKPDKNGSFFNNLFSLSLSDGSVKPLTNAVRVYDAAASPDGKNIYCICFRQGVFGIYRYSTDQGDLKLVTNSEEGAPFLKISVNPRDPDAAVVSKFDQGRSRLFLWSEKTARLDPLGPGLTQEESPFWAEDGRIYFSADYDGVFDIYSLLPDGSDLRRHTNTSGGYFFPQVTPEGEIIASYYNADRFSIISIPSQQSVSYTPSDSYPCTFAPLPKPTGKVIIKSQQYTPKLRRPVYQMIIAAEATKNRGLFSGSNTVSNDSSLTSFYGGLITQKTDALQKRFLMSRIFAGALFIKYDSVSSSESDDIRKSERFSGLFMPSFRKSNAGGITAGGERKHYPLKLPLLEDVSLITIPSHRLGLSQSDEKRNDSTTALPSLILFAIPGIAVQNSFGVPTVGCELHARLLQLFLPVYLSATPYAEFRIAREWYAGTQLNLVSMPFQNFLLIYNLPFYVRMVHTGYYNEDFYYNLADCSYMNFSLGPRLVPGLRDIYNEIESKNDTIAETVFGWSSEMELFKGIQLWKYASLQLYSFTSATYHKKKTFDDRLNDDMIIGEKLLDGVSDTYIMSVNGVRTVFPVIRTVNRGRRNYFDAWYGSVGYNLFFYTNGSVFGSSPPDPISVLSDRNYRPGSVFCDHIITIGSELGRYKANAFFTSFKLELSYRILREKFYFSCSSGL